MTLQELKKMARWGIAKWCNELPQVEPLYGHKSGKLSKTHWMAFVKLPKKGETK